MIAAQLAPAADAVRLSLHVIAAAAWVGGQITVLGLLPTARRLGTDVPRQVAVAFSRVAWPAYAVLVATGMWNIAATHPGRQSGAWQAVLWVKVALVALAGAATALHTRSSTRLGLALGGAVAGFTSVAAVVFGVLLAG